MQKYFVMISQHIYICVIPCLSVFFLQEHNHQLTESLLSI